MNYPLREPGQNDRHLADLYLKPTGNPHYGMLWVAASLAVSSSIDTITDHMLRDGPDPHPDLGYTITRFYAPLGTGAEADAQLAEALTRLGTRWDGALRDILDITEPYGVNTEHDLFRTAGDLLIKGRPHPTDSFLPPAN